jgi:hypothetical protein
MDSRVIYLDQEDDIVSIADRLEWVVEPRAVLVLPPDGNVLVEHLDLVRLRRHVEDVRLEVGLVTLDGRVRAKARALGIPVFSTVEASQRSRRGWWRGRRRPERFRPAPVDEADRQEVQRRLAPRPEWQRWLRRYIAILLFFLTLAILFVGIAYAVPGATIVLRPEIKAIQVVKPIVADPQLSSVSFTGASVPGRELVVVEEWRAQVETTGIIEIPDAPARGTVVLVNRLAQPVTVPAGTRVATSTGQRVIFQLVESAEVPGVVGGTAEVEIIAIEPGPTGNVNANLVNRVEGSLALQLEVRNLEPTEGGGFRLAPAVAEADRERLRAQVVQQLQALALVEMEGLLADNEFLAHESLRLVETYHESFSHFLGEQADRLTLEVRAELHATAVDETQAVGIVYEELAAEVPPGYELVPDTLAFQSGEVLGVDSQGGVSFEMIGEGTVAAELRLDELIAEVAGQETEVALAYLNGHLPLRDYPQTRVWPNWFGRMPYMPVRIQTVVDTGQAGP